MARAILCAPLHNRKGYIIMAASEHTPHMQLSQFGLDDRPSWIDDYNQDMRTIDTALSDGNQAVTDMTNEITAIKNKLDTSNTVYGYFQYNGNELITINGTASTSNIAIGDTSQPTVGGDGITLLQGQGIQVEHDGVYVIWSSINIGPCTPNPIGGSGYPFALALAYIHGVEATGPAGVINGGFITPVMSHIESTSPQQYVAQSVSLPPTVVSLRAGDIATFTLTTDRKESNRNPLKMYHMESSTGIVQIR